MSDQESTELKAGHPPAVKVGGMRVVQNKSHSAEKSSPEPKHSESKDETEEKTEETPEEETEDQETTDVERRAKFMVSGAPAREKVDFPPEAIKAFHEKPVPAKQKHAAAHVHVPNITQVHQPRSSNH